MLNAQDGPPTTELPGPRVASANADEPRSADTAVPHGHKSRQGCRQETGSNAVVAEVRATEVWTEPSVRFWLPAKVLRNAVLVNSQNTRNSSSWQETVLGLISLHVTSSAVGREL